MSEILLPVLIVGIIGLIAGVGLTVAAIVMSVPHDERIDAVRDALPGANCGACGYTGCDDYAKAVVEQEEKTSLCAPGGANTISGIAAALGKEPEPYASKTAVVRCFGSYDNTENQMQYRGISTCAAAAQHFGGVSRCPAGCMGLGDCASACPFGAVSVCNGVAVIDSEKCMACGLCVKKCPKNIIEIVPVRESAIVRCRNTQKGGETRKICKSGCIGCSKCKQVCEFGAVKIENFLAEIDHEKCTACGKCMAECPVGAINHLTFKSAEQHC